MVQRVQTVYLLLSILLLGLLFWFPLADISVDGKMYLFDVTGIYLGKEQIFSGLPIYVFLVIIILLHVISVFMYRKRIRQIRIMIFTIILLIGLFGIFFYFTFAGFKIETASFKIPVLFPLIAVILDYLAVRGIGKDEALIRSLNRIR